ncbi:type II toxin-antitoxin system ParD family antitoxin [Psychromarinibacter sp. C21-152]|uniref:Type II toxin-antitoxin system ParD family antitoxin n=1 Tax=Psychromarinibacter sediminicola TaxID=3033385 RepID=A0AAE3NPC1_9RHOB|nr:type II toxin-antitoxin system ParD family antitoxin [Psychromarinibacter sediminicola]MDF0601048.1 type II toxin-antitoxin system ParD family antitoxin [Psychromarinibacter sediminicola]
MATMNVSLPDAMKEWVEAQAETGRYANASDYVRDLIRRDQDRRQALAELEAEIDKGLASGPAEPLEPMSEIVAEARRRSPIG